MLNSKHSQISIRPQGITLEQDWCYDNFSTAYDSSNITFTEKLETKQYT